MPGVEALANSLDSATPIKLKPPAPGRRRGLQGWTAIGAVGILAMIGLLAVILLSNRSDANSTLTPTQAAVAANTTVAPTEKPNLETLAAQTLTADALQIAKATASHTKIPTNTPTSRKPWPQWWQRHTQAMQWRPRQQLFSAKDNLCSRSIPRKVNRG